MTSNPLGSRELSNYYITQLFQNVSYTPLEKLEHAYQNILSILPLRFLKINQNLYTIISICKFQFKMNCHEISHGSRIKPFQSQNFIISENQITFSPDFSYCDKLEKKYIYTFLKILAYSLLTKEHKVG